MGFDQDVAANLGVERQKHSFGGSQRRAPSHGALAQSVLQGGLGDGELSPVVDANNFLFVRDQGFGREASRIGDLDDVGKVIFALGVIGLDCGQKGHRLGAAEGDRPGVAKAQGALFVARVLFFPDSDQPSAALDQAAVTGRIGGLETERHDISP